MAATQHLQSLAEKVLTELKEVGLLAGQALASLAWTWPLRGIFFSLTHPNVLLSVRTALVRSLGASAVVFGVLALFTYVPQLAVLAVVSGPLAPVLALLLVGAESLFLVSFFARPLFLEPALSQLFDATLRAQGQAQLVKDGKTRSATSVESTLVRPLQALSRGGISRYLLSLPLNLVPVAGTALFLIYNGDRGGPGWHTRYFQLKGLTKSQRQAFVQRHRAEYTAFGTATLVFNFIPIVGLVFSFTNTVGAAMWAAQLEARANLIDTPAQAKTLPVEIEDVAKTK